VPFTLDHSGKYRTEEDKLKIHKLNTTQKEQTMQNTAKQNYPGLVTSYDTQPRNEVGFSTVLLNPNGAHTAVTRRLKNASK